MSWVGAGLARGSMSRPQLTKPEGCAKISKMGKTLQEHYWPQREGFNRLPNKPPPLMGGGRRLVTNGQLVQSMSVGLNNEHLGQHLLSCPKVGSDLGFIPKKETRACGHHSSLPI